MSHHHIRFEQKTKQNQTTYSLICYRKLSNIFTIFKYFWPFDIRRKLVIFQMKKIFFQKINFQKTYKIILLFYFQIPSLGVSDTLIRGLGHQSLSYR